MAENKIIDPITDVLQEFPLAMLALAELTKKGAEKYAPRDWLHTRDAANHTAKMGRHLIDEIVEGPVNEKDGGHLHATCVAWNAIARLEHILMAQIAEEQKEKATTIKLQPKIEPKDYSNVDKFRSYPKSDFIIKHNEAGQAIAIIPKYEELP